VAVGRTSRATAGLVGLHHTLEDTSLFTGLRRLDGRLAPVTARLTEEGAPGPARARDLRLTGCDTPIISGP
jgi:hypothetical protein